MSGFLRGRLSGYGHLFFRRFAPRMRCRVRSETTRHFSHPPRRRRLGLSRPDSRACHGGHTRPRTDQHRRRPFGGATDRILQDGPQSYGVAEGGSVHRRSANLRGGPIGDSEGAYSAENPASTFYLHNAPVRARGHERLRALLSGARGAPSLSRVESDAERGKGVHADRPASLLLSGFLPLRDSTRGAASRRRTREEERHAAEGVHVEHNRHCPFPNTAAPDREISKTETRTEE